MTELSVHLPSDVCLAELPANSPSDFKINAPGLSEVVGEWEVGVTDVYPPSRVTVQNVGHTLYVYLVIVKPALIGNKLNHYSTHFLFAM